MALFMRTPHQSPAAALKDRMLGRRSRRFKSKLIRVRNSRYLVQPCDIRGVVAEMPLRYDSIAYSFSGGKIS